MITRIRKRDGKTVAFNEGKIEEAIFKAAMAVGGHDHETAKQLGKKVVNYLESKGYTIPTVEEVQDAVEKILIEGRHAKTAKAYILYRQERTQIREKQKEILNGRITKLPFTLNALQVIAKRYLVRDEDGNIRETPEEMFERVAHTLANCEKDYGKNVLEIQQIEKEFLDILTRFEFTPAGRTLANAGAPTPLVSNCIVLHFEDSMDGIFTTLRDASLLQQAGSGLGFPFHLLRPAGTLTKRTRGVASGPVSFLQAYNKAFGVIKQQNRHGANMAVMRVDHPDILEFIHSKDKEGEIVNFNISVGLTNDFMEKVANNDSTPWMCSWNGKKMKPHRIYRDDRFIVTETVEETMTAREIFEEIISSAWSNGEPGCVFLDRVNETNPVPGLGRIEACNPCVTGNTLVSTENGFIKISELAEKYKDGGISIVCDNRIPLELYNSNGTINIIYKSTKGTQLNNMSAAWNSGYKDVWKLETNSGYEIESTKDHKIMTLDGWVEVKDLTKEHKILIQSGEGRFNVNKNIPFEVKNRFIGDNGRLYSYNFPKEWNRELGQFLGWIIGDGWIRNKEKEYMVGLTFGSQDEEILKYIKSIGNKIYGVDRQEIKRERNTYHLNYGSRHFVEYLEKLGITTLMSENKEVPNTIFTAPKEAVSGFLQGLFSADGTVMLDEKNGNYYIRLTTKSIKLAKQVQLILLNFGIKSKIYNKSRPSREIFPYKNKKGELKVYHSDGILFEVDIHGKNIELFNEQIGFLCNKNNEKITKILQKDLKDYEFFDKVKIVEYIGKETVYDLTEPATHSFIGNGFVVSNCGEQFLHDGDVCNLGSINLEKFVKNGQIDFERLKHVTRVSIRMLDNVIDLTEFPVEKVNKTFRSNRRIGLGIMGFADMLYQLHIAYNSKEGFATAEKVMGCIQEASHKMSQELAEEKGLFPNWDMSIYKELGIKMRNAALTNIAPTGTISMALDVSSGVEPYFALAYTKKNILGGTQLYYLNKHLKQELEKYNLYNEEIMKKIYNEGTLTNIAEIPEEMKKVFVTAMDISAEDHIRMQAAFQNNIDNSISKTCNFPEDATKEDVLKGYLLAWSLGCKGCTVYRNNSRQHQVLELNKDKKSTIIKAVEEAKVMVMQTTSGETEMALHKKIPSNPKLMEFCPECDSKVEVKEGCITCVGCGFSLCSI